MQFLFCLGLAKSMPSGLGVPTQPLPFAWPWAKTEFNSQEVKGRVDGYSMNWSCSVRHLCSNYHFSHPGEREIPHAWVSLSSFFFFFFKNLYPFRDAFLKRNHQDGSSVICIAICSSFKA
uniref:Secreted protein n=1 Tax=Mus musculus TaxID=10090 RepID=Q8BP85_MOUSE|nr:unnamed protein product [Mus musculus]